MIERGLFPRGPAVERSRRNMLLDHKAADGSYIALEQISSIMTASGSSSLSRYRRIICLSEQPPTSAWSSVFWSKNDDVWPNINEAGGASAANRTDERLNREIRHFKTLNPKLPILGVFLSEDLRLNSSLCNVPSRHAYGKRIVEVARWNRTTHPIAVRLVRAPLYLKADDERAEGVPLYLPNDPRQSKYTCLVWIYIAPHNPLRRIFGLSSHNAIYSRRVEHMDKKYPRLLRPIAKFLGVP